MEPCREALAWGTRAQANGQDLLDTWPGLCLSSDPLSRQCLRFQGPKGRSVLCGSCWVGPLWVGWLSQTVSQSDTWVYHVSIGGGGMDWHQFPLV